MTFVKINSGSDKPLVPGFNDVFDSVFNDTFFSNRTVSRVPAANISETADRYQIELAAPGLQKEDFKINLDGDMLSISVERNPQNIMNERNYSKREYSYNSFVRSFILPESADDNHIEAIYTDGVLHVDIAKKEEAKSVVRQIEIK